MEVNNKFMSSLRKLVKSNDEKAILDTLKLESISSKCIYDLRAQITEIALDKWKPEELVYLWHIIDNKYYRQVWKEYQTEEKLEERPSKKTKQKKSK